ncbi:MAG TPA: diguanylate cyclase [Anaerolineales bacterium]|nr:diguanylate cyclase [Anaerolineales bacterium]
MSLEWIIFASILLINSLAALFIAALLTRRPHAPGRRSLLVMLVMLAVWNFSYAMITLATSLEAKLFWLKIENIGILSTPIFWLFFALRYNRLDGWLNRYTASLFFIIPALSLLFLFSTQWFHLYYASVRQVSEGGGPLIIERGSWYFVAVIYTYLASLAAIVLLIRRAIQHRNIYRRQMYVLIAAVLIPTLVNVVYQLALSFLPKSALHIDLTPISFMVSAALIVIGVFGLRIFNLIPIARHTVLEHIPEMVFVVNAQDVVVDANTVAQKMLGKSMDAIIGKDPLDVFHDWPELLHHFLGANESRNEIQIPGDPPRALEVMVTALYNSEGLLEGRVIVAHDITEHKWLENDLTFANESLTRQLEEINQLRDELREQAIRDPLTEVYNRRYMNEFLSQEVARAERDGTPFSVVIMDMDNFKMFNDTYGHKCGDIILQEIAAFLVQHTRKGDVVCRFGGEEFVILMPGATLEKAYERAETWRQDFADTTIEYEGMKLRATFSAGVASYPQHGDTDEFLLQAADRALYRSKDAGKNKVTMFSL